MARLKVGAAASCLLLLAASSAMAAPAAAPKIPDAKIPDLAAPSLTPLASAHRFEELFQPFRTDLAALSPDGKRLAYTFRSGSMLSVMIVSVDEPSKAVTKFEVLNDEDATPMLHNTKERTPAAIRWMRWATPNRIVVETNAAPALNSGNAWYSLPGVIVAFDADGSHRKTLVTPDDVANTEAAPPPVAASSETTVLTPDQDPEPPPAFSEFESPDNSAPIPLDPGARTNRMGRRPRVIDLFPGDPESIIVRADDVATQDRPGRSESFKVNIRTGKLTSIGEEIDYAGYAVLVDRDGHRGVTVPTTTAIGFPHRFAYEPPKASPKPLDDIARAGGVKGFTVSPDNFFGERSVPVDFDADSSILYFASNVGRDTYGLYGLNLKTGQRTNTSIEHPTLDLYEPVPGRFALPSPLVFDRYTRKLAGVRIVDRNATTRWLRPEIQAVQAQLEQTLQGRSVEIEDWDEAGNRFLVLARGPTDAGAFYVFDRTTKKLAEFARRAPGLDSTKTHPALDFALNSPQGGRITGTLTLPYNSKVKPVPVVVLCQPEPWQRVSPEYQPAVQALADMDICVVQLNTRGAWGSGSKQREVIKQGFDAVAAGDTVAALDWLMKRFPISKKRVVIMGERRGAYVALRTAQLYPDRFLSVIALEPTINLSGWMSEARWTSGDAAPLLTRGFFGDPARVKATPLLDSPQSIRSSVLLLAYRGNEGEPPTFTYSDAQRLESGLKRGQSVVRFVDLTRDYMQRLPRAKADVFREIESFLTEYLYDYRVDVGAPVPKKDEEKK